MRTCELRAIPTYKDARLGHKHKSIIRCQEE